MDTTPSINDRKWKLVEIPQREMKSIPLVENPTIPWRLAVGMDSPDAQDLERRGIEPFYIDLQQLEAGLDKVYGTLKLSNFAEDYTFPDGTVAKAGALYMELSKVDLESFVFTVMVEDI